MSDEGTMDRLLQLFADVAIPEDYSARDRYDDFRSVFLGSEQGRRALKQILTWGHVLRVPRQRHPIDPYFVVQTEGERSLALRMLAVMMVEPKELPTRQRTSEKETDNG